MPIFHVCHRCGPKSSSRASMKSEGHGEHSPATRANMAGVAGTVDGINLLDASSICVVHTLATCLPADISGSSSDDTRRLTSFRNMRGPGCEASPTLWPLRQYLDENLVCAFWSIGSEATFFWAARDWNSSSEMSKKSHLDHPFGSLRQHRTHLDYSTVISSKKSFLHIGLTVFHPS